MKSFEVIHEIPNSCSNNQMRDVFFDEIDCESPMEYVKQQFRGKSISITEDKRDDGNLIIYVTVDALMHKYIFTEI